MRKRFLSLTLTLSVFISLFCPTLGVSEAQGIALPWKKEHVDALRVFQFLNYIDFGLAETIETGDALVLARQYDTLAGNLDLAVIRDEQVISVIEALGKQVDRTETNRLTQEVNHIFSNRLSDGIYRAIDSKVTTEEAVLKRIAAFGAPWYDYKKNRSLYTNGMRGKISLTDGQIRQLTEIRKDMLRISWELFGKYDVGKNERLSEGEMDRFVFVIDQDEPELRGRQLKRLLKDQPAFESFPPFWFYSGMAEIEGGGDRGYAMMCLDRYVSSYREIFKKDPLLAMAAMVRLSMTPKSNRVQRLRNLDHMKGNCSASDWQYYLMAAIMQAEMGMISQAKEDLQRNIDNGHQVSLCSRVMGSILLSDRDVRGFRNTMSRLLSDESIRTGDILSLAARCETEECSEWLKEQVGRMKLSVAGSDEKCVRIEMPAEWINFPCSMDLSVVWSKDVQGWESSLPYTALAVLPKGKDDERNRLIETPTIQEDPGLPGRLTATINHPLFFLKTEWELIPPEEGLTRDIFFGLGKAFPFYRPEAGEYRLSWFSFEDGIIHVYKIYEEVAKPAVAVEEKAPPEAGGKEEDQESEEEDDQVQAEPVSDDEGPFTDPDMEDDPVSEDQNV